MEVIEAIFCTSLDDNQGTVSALNASNGTVIARYLGGGICSPHGLSISGEYILSCEKGKPMLHLWQYNKQRCEKKRLVVQGKVNAVAFSRDSEHIAVAVENKVYLYQAASGRCLGIGSRHIQAITAMKFSHDSCLLCCGGDDCLVTVWKLAGDFCSNNEASLPSQTFSDHCSPIVEVLFTSSNSKIVSISVGIDCKLFDLVTRTVLMTFSFQVDFTAVAVSPFEETIYLGCRDGNILLTSLADLPRTREYQISEDNRNLSGHSKAVSCLACPLDGCCLISGSLDATIRIWNVLDLSIVRVIEQKGPVTNILYALLSKSVFSQDNKPLSYVHDFINTKNVVASKDETAEVEGSMMDVDTIEVEEPTFEVFITEDLLPPTPLDIRTESSDSKKINSETDELKSLNNAIYKFAVNHLLGKNTRPTC